MHSTQGVDMIEETKIEANDELHTRSLSMSSTNSSQSNLTSTPQQSYLLINRFPSDFWEEALRFIDEYD